MEKIEISKEEALRLKYRLKGIELTKVVAGLIEKDNKYLIAKRLTGNELVVGKWEFPGGKVEEGEEESKAIEREIKEEFNLSIKALENLTCVIYEYPNKTVDIRLWKATVEGDNFSMDENDHDAYKWVTFEEIENYDLCPADRELYNKIKS